MTRVLKSSLQDIKASQELPKKQLRTPLIALVTNLVNESDLETWEDEVRPFARNCIIYNIMQVTSSHC